jgi:hypothetical protein
MERIFLTGKMAFTLSVSLPVCVPGYPDDESGQGIEGVIQLFFIDATRRRFTTIAPGTLFEIRLTADAALAADDCISTPRGYFIVTVYAVDSGRAHSVDSLRYSSGCANGAFKIILKVLVSKISLIHNSLLDDSG